MTSEGTNTRWTGDHWEGWNGEQWVRWTGTEWVTPEPAPQPQPEPQPAPQASYPSAPQPQQQPSYQPQMYGPGYLTDRSDKSVQAVFAWVFTVLTLLYFLPWAIAATRGKSNSGLLGLLTLLLGWTFIGWIVLLVMACQPHQIIARSGPIVTYPGNYGSAGDTATRY
jgi:Superinfection immunity protein